MTWHTQDSVSVSSCLVSSASASYPRVTVENAWCPVAPGSMCASWAQGVPTTPFNNPLVFILLE